MLKCIVVNKDLNMKLINLDPGEGNLSIVRLTFMDSQCVR